MTESDLARYGRKVMNYFFDGLPRNDVSPDTPIYCLGRRYDSLPPRPSTSETNSEPVIVSRFPLQSGLEQTTQNSELTFEPDGSEELEVITQSQADASKQSEGLSRARSPEDEAGWPADFLDDFESRIWMTYRSNFPPIARSQDTHTTMHMSFAVRLRNLASTDSFTADTGWGCMIRSGQSLLANAVLLARVGRDWRRSRQTYSDEASIISLFADDPKAPFSIHSFVEHGASACGKHPGEWFGPSATARCIQALVDRHAAGELAAYTTSDCSDVYEDAFLKQAMANASFTPTLILITTRLGLDRVTPVYWEALKATLRLPHSIGIAGGRPSSSHYFVASQGNDFFYLDPHHTRPALPLHPDASQYTLADIDSCHTRRLRRLNLSGMDPSMLIGFLIKSKSDWEEWKTAVKQLSSKPVILLHEHKDVYMTKTCEREAAIDEVETFDTDEDE